MPGYSIIQNKNSFHFILSTRESTGVKPDKGSSFVEDTQLETCAVLGLEVLTAVVAAESQPMFRRNMFASIVRVKEEGCCSLGSFFKPTYKGNTIIRTSVKFYQITRHHIPGAVLFKFEVLSRRRHTTVEAVWIWSFLLNVSIKSILLRK
jgi:hypothetical protein